MTYQDIINDQFDDDISARSLAVADIESSPDDAQRAIKLGRATGVSPTVVAGDLEAFDRQTKSNYAAEIIQKNPHIADYVRGNPMASRLSNDDYGQLDLVSEKLQELAKKSFEIHASPLGAYAKYIAAITPDTLEVLHETWDNVVHLGQILSGDAKPTPQDEEILGNVGKMLQEQGWTPEQIEGEVRTITERMRRGEALQTILFTVPTALTAPAIGAFRHFISKPLERKTGFPHDQTEFGAMVALGVFGLGHQIKGMGAKSLADSFVQKGKEPPPLMDPAIDRIKLDNNNQDVKALFETLGEAAKSSTRERDPDTFAGFMRQHTDGKVGISSDKVRELYGDNVPTPEDGILGWVPRIKEQLAATAETGGDIMVPVADLLAHGDPAILREFKDDIRTRPGNITKAEADKVREAKEELEQITSFEQRPNVPREDKQAYIDLTPAEEKFFATALRDLQDNVPSVKAEGTKRLVWDPAHTGAVVDWLDFVKASGDKGLPPSAHQSGRFARRIVGGPEEYRIETLDQTKARMEKVEPHFPIDAMRDSTGLEPLFQIADRKLKLQRVKEAGSDVARVEGGFKPHDFEFLNEKGEPVGYLMVAESKDGKTLYVEDIQATLGDRGAMANQFGPRLIRDILIQLKEAFPDAETLQGHRVSGARDKADTYVTHGSVSIKFQELLSETTDLPARLRDLGVWRDSGPTKVLLPEPGELFGRDKDLAKLADAITEELNRIIPKQVTHAPALDIKYSGGGKVGGIYQQFNLQMPLLFWSIVADDPRMSARHEAIHHLRQQGFFSLHEWSQLRNAALENGWLEKYKINQKYHNLGEGARIEESVAEAFGEWRNGKLKAEGPLEALFQRLQEILDRIKYRVKEFMGKDLTADEIFAAVERGEVGRREGNAPMHPEAFRESAQRKQMYHGSPTANIKQFNGKYTYLTQEESVAKSFAEDVILGAQKGRGDQVSPTVYKVTVDVPEAKTLDLRKPQHQEAYNQAREEWNKTADEDHQLPKLTSGGFIQSPAGLPGYGNASLILDAMKGFDAIHVHEGHAHGNSLLVRTEKTEIQQPKQRPKEQQLDLGQDLTRMEDREPFAEAAAIGMTVPQYKRYMKLVERRNAEDVEHATDKAEKEIGKRQSAAWREAEVPIREAVVDEFGKRPDVQAVDAFRNGMGGTEGKDKFFPKLDPETLGAEGAMLPPRWLDEARGLHPDELAPFFGFESGKAMVDAMVEYHLGEVASAKRPIDYKRQLINAEVTKRMELEHGKLKENIADEVKERVLSETQIELLHEETMALAPKTAEYSLTKEQFKANALSKLYQLDLSAMNSDKLLAQAGKAGKAAEMALLKGDPTTAFQEKQRQYINILQAKEAHRIEKEFDKFARTAKRFSQRDVRAFDSETRDYVQAMLAEAGIVGKRSQLELNAALERHGNSLAEFVGTKINEGWKAEVDPAFFKEIKSLDEMSVGDFLSFKHSIDSLVKIGAAQQRMLGAVRGIAFEDIKAEALANLAERPIRPAGSYNPIWALEASLQRPENLVKELDMGKELGPLWNHVIRPVMDAKAAKANELQALGDRMKKIAGGDRKWMKSLKDEIPNDFLFDSHDQVLFKMTRSDMINIMMNFGNESNRSAFVNGWVDKRLGALAPDEFKLHAGILEAKLWQMFKDHATKEDWRFVQNVWDIFASYKDRLAELEDRLGSVPSKWIEAQPIDTPHGQFKGGYLPIIYDADRSGIRELREKAGGKNLFHTDFWSATLPEGFLKERTGYRDYIKFQGTTDEIIARMEQMVHVLTHKEAVMNARRFVTDREIGANIRKHYGPEYADQLPKWIEDVANQSNLDERALQGIAKWQQFFRLNLVTSTLGFSLKVLETPSTGRLGPHRVAQAMADPRVVNDAMKLSKEVPLTEMNLDRDLRQALEKNLGQAGLDNFRKEAIHWGFYLITQVEKRLRSGTFMLKYREELAKGRSQEDAIALADSAVREYHGAQGVADLPAVLRHQSEGWRMLTMFYGYLNTTFNISRKIGGNVKRGEWKEAFANAYAGVIVPSIFGALVYNKIKDDDTFWTISARGLGMGLASMIPFGREAATYMSEGHLPGTAWGSFLRSVGGVYGDVKNWYDGKPVKKPISHAATLIGGATGLPVNQFGRTGQFASDVADYKQHPQGFFQWLRGINNGEANPRR